LQDRGLAAYISELIGTMLLTFAICTVVTLYAATSPDAQTGSDFAVIGLVQGLALFALIMSFGTVSGGHFNPAVTIGAAVLRRIDPIDAIVYILAQLSGGVLGALLTKAFLVDEGRASDYGTPKISPLIGGAFQGALIEGIGAFVLVLTVLAVALNPEARRWAAISIGGALGMAVMVLGPLTGGSFNPARWFGPALVGNHFTDAWAYIIGPLVGGLLAAAVYKFIIEPSSGPVQEAADTVAPRGPAPPAGESPQLRQERGPGPGGPPPSSPPGGIAGS
jgi:glycerol uptake facilitator